MKGLRLFGWPVSRPLVWSVVGIGVLVSLIVFFFFTFYQKVPVTVYERPQPEALRDPYLAFGRLLEKMGRPAAITDDIVILDNLVPGQPGVVILGGGRSRLLTAGRVQHLFDWVAGGGHLIVPEDADAKDPILARLCVRWADIAYHRAHRNAAPRSNDDEEDDDDVEQDAPEQAKATSACPHPDVHAANPPRSLHECVADNLVRVTFPGGSGILKIDSQPGQRLLPSYRPDWSADSSQGMQIAHYVHGRGGITVMPSLSLVAFTGNIRGHDHAEFLWTLVNSVAPKGMLVLMSRLHVPSLREWLLSDAWMILISLAVLIAAWLWRIVPRFGPLLLGNGQSGETVLLRRGLVEHLRAIARSVWREGQHDGKAEGLAYLHRGVARALLERAALRDPLLLKRTPAQQAEALATLSGLPLEQVLSALVPRIVTESGAPLPGTLARARFTDAIRALQAMQSRF